MEVFKHRQYLQYNIYMDIVPIKNSQEKDNRLEISPPSASIMFHITEVRDHLVILHVHTHVCNTIFIAVMFVFGYQYTSLSGGSFMLKGNANHWYTCSVNWV